MSVLVLCVVSLLLGLRPSYCASIETLDSSLNRNIMSSAVTVLPDQGNGEEETAVALSTLLRSLNEAEDKIETTKKLIFKLLSSMKSVPKERYHVLNTKNNKYVLVGESTIKDNWQKAVQNCKNRGMELLAIENEAEQKQLEAIIGEWGYNIFPLWIGASAIATDGGFTWSYSGKPINYTKWNTGEPNVEREQNCVALKKSDQGYFWNVEDCGNSNYFTCQQLSGSTNK